MTDNDDPQMLRELYRSLNERWRPEEVSLAIFRVLDLSHDESRILRVATKAARDRFWSSMSNDFARPAGMERQIESAKRMFGLNGEVPPDDVEQIVAWVKRAGQTIGKEFGRNEFKFDRLSSSDRKAAGIDISRRQYNKRFRMAMRLERKARKLEREQFKRALAIASKSRLAAGITWKQFSRHQDTACFIAYYVSRCNLRSVFTNESQTRPYDEICDMLMKRCRREVQPANWWAVAHVYPDRDVLRRLSDAAKGKLLSKYYDQLLKAAEFLKELWQTNELSADFVVQRGNDSTTWNLAAGAWNKLREGWFALVYDLGLTNVVDQLCPGKVLRLMAADVAHWHRMSGGVLHQDTKVWQELPFPWEVLLGEATCTKQHVEKACQKHGIDPVRSGWSAPRPKGKVERFTPTPELVHGVSISSPLLAGILRQCGFFSGKY